MQQKHYRADYGLFKLTALSDGERMSKKLEKRAKSNNPSV
jgi:hypothetical protein